MNITVRLLRVTLLIMAAVLCLVGYAVAQTCVVPPSGLIGWWPGDGNANDIAGTNHGTLQGGASFAAGTVGQAFSLDGVDDYVNFGEPPSLNTILTGDFTIDAWVTVPPSGNGRVIGRGDAFAAQQNKFIFVDFVDYKMRAFVRGDTGETNTLSMFSNTVLPSSSAVHFAFVRKKGVQGELYINGVLDVIGAPDNAGSITFSASRPLVIGAADVGAVGGTTSFFNGRIDEVEIFNRALSAVEIKAIFDAGSAGKCKAALAYSCAGFEPPFNVPILLKRKVNRAIPLKMQLFSDGTPITDSNIGGAAPVVNVTYSAGGGPAEDITDQLDPVGHSNDGNEFSYDLAAGQWVYHLGTKPFTAAGTYTVTVAPGDTSYTVAPTCTGQFVRSD